MTIGDFLETAEGAFRLCVKEIFDDNEEKAKICDMESRTIFMGYSCDINEVFLDIPILKFTVSVSYSMLAAMPTICLYVPET